MLAGRGASRVCLRRTKGSSDIGTEARGAEKATRHAAACDVEARGCGEDDAAHARDPTQRAAQTYCRVLGFWFFSI